MGDGRRAALSASATNAYLDALARAKGGVALLTSAEAAEASEEGVRWGGGHGVFTHYLLEGMRGAADGYGGVRDGVVSVGELFEYVRDRVVSDTDSRQHPLVGPSVFDRSLPVAITGELNVSRHLALGRSLTSVGWLLDDPAPFLLAARQFAVAADLKRLLPEADAERGAALLAAGLPAEAHTALRGAVASGADLPSETWLFSGVASAELNDVDGACDALREHCRRDPHGPDAAWARDYVDWLERGKTSAVHAVLIGVATGSLAADVGMDVDRMRALVTDRFEARPADVVTLVNEEATRPAILAAFDALRSRVHADDVAIIYFSGHGIRILEPEPWTALVTWDMEAARADLARKNFRAIGISPDLLLAAATLPVRAVLVILDCSHAEAFANPHDSLPDNVTFLCGCRANESGYSISGGGAFTMGLVDALRHEPESYDSVIRSVDESIAGRGITGQHSVVVGDGTRRVLQGEWGPAQLWRAWRARVPRANDGEKLSGSAPDWPTAAIVIGRLLAAQGKYSEARHHLERGWAALPEQVNIGLDLADVCLHAQEPTIAGHALREVRTKTGGSQRDHIDDAVQAPAQRSPNGPQCCG